MGRADAVDHQYELLIDHHLVAISHGHAHEASERMPNVRGHVPPECHAERPLFMRRIKTMVRVAPATIRDTRLSHRASTLARELISETRRSRVAGSNTPSQWMTVAKSEASRRAGADF